MGSAVVMLVALVVVAAPAAARRHAVVSLATSESRTAGGPVVITLTGTANAVDTSASGTFRAVGAIRDTGTFTVQRNLTTLHDLWRLSGKRGKLTIDLHLDHLDDRFRYGRIRTPAREGNGKDDPPGDQVP
jgi:hypothetical protein